MHIHATHFSSGESIPPMHTCDGENILPTFTITDVPDGVVSFALVMDDSDIPDEIKKARSITKFDHLVLYNMSGDMRTISHDTHGGVFGVNSYGEKTYKGPCPPPDLAPYTHRYSFRLYALSQKLQLQASATLDVLEAEARKYTLATASYIGVYSRHVENER